MREWSYSEEKPDVGKIKTRMRATVGGDEVQVFLFYEKWKDIVQAHSQMIVCIMVSVKVEECMVLEQCRTNAPCCKSDVVYSSVVMECEARRTFNKTQLAFGEGNDD